MREVNFSIPNVNKASVGITTALYDRRALDCTSTLPLINSLNHLAYLTTSSARIRDILTVDGGIERLVCILKQGRNGDLMSIWKWNLAFQCVVNIGVRGTEGVRTRVVEADMVPVIATILDNYIKVIDRCREKADELKQKQGHDHPHRHRNHDHKHSSSKTSPSNTGRSTPQNGEPRHIARQELSAMLDGSETLAGPSVASTGQGADAASTTISQLYANVERAILTPTHQLLNSHGLDAPYVTTSQETHPLAPAIPIADSNEIFNRALRHVDRLTSITTFGATDLVTQPMSPTTPVPLLQLRPPTVRSATNLDVPIGRSRRRPSIRHQNSTAESDDFNGDSMPSDEAPDAEMAGAPEIQSAVGIQDITMDDNEAILTGDSLDLTNPTASEAHQDAETFNITHRTNLDGSIRDTMTHTPVPPVGLSPSRPTLGATPHPSTASSAIPRYLLDRHLIPNPQLLSAMPREEDVLMSLQLLAYVSKYCCLRTYFQKSHIVPTLTISKELLGIESEEEDAPSSENEGDGEDEFLLDEDFNLFPLVEKFTVRYHSTDMQYWAGVVMRNLCRKDDTRGGIRQCAYYQCGKWEEFTRQFAKCRRCRRTKYCSKECQKSAWAYHRHWCVAAAS